MHKSKMLIFALIAVLVSGTGLAFAQEEPEIAFSKVQVIIIRIGALAGLVTAYNEYRKNKNSSHDVTFSSINSLTKQAIKNNIYLQNNSRHLCAGIA